MKEKFEIRQIDAIETEPFMWSWNDSYFLSFFETTGNPKRAFLEALKRENIRFKKGTIRVSFDGDIYTLEARKTDEPLFAAIPVY